MSDLHLASGNIEKFLEEPILRIMIKLTSQGRHAAGVTLGCF